MRISWPAEDVEKLKALWSGNLSATQIERHFGGKYTRNGIYGKVHRLNLESRSISDRPRTAPTRSTPKPKFLIAQIAQENIVAKEIAKAEHEPLPIGPIGDYPKQPACRWPHGTGLAFQYCGHPLSAPSSYCSHHRARARVKPHNLTIRGHK